MADKAAGTTASSNPAVLNPQVWESLQDAAKDQQPVQGLTHTFYRYPARFSPQFARTVIEALTEPGDLIVDPFMGGGTTLVEAAVLGRRSVGTDISSLAEFLAKTKTTRLSDEEMEAATRWADQVPALTLNKEVDRPFEWIDDGYQRNINTVNTWPIRKSLELALANLPSSSSQALNNFLRCAILSVGQWALDCRLHTPAAADFRVRLRETIYDMVIAMNQLEDAIEQAPDFFNPVVLRGSASELDRSGAISATDPPRLVLTSPPYPGVHVVYHRWQIHGRRETPAPFWIADRRDGRGTSFYTLGERRQEDLRDYFDNLGRCFEAIRRIAASDTVVVQLVAFSEPETQLDRYLGVMAEAGFAEIEPRSLVPKRIWREVPNRRWYANQKEELASKDEVLLVHQPVK